VGDNQHSFHFVKYREVDNQMYCFADDVVPRWVTAAVPLDYNTVAGADKFGNVVRAQYDIMHSRWCMMRAIVYTAAQQIRDTSPYVQ
jgi:hypothetical protein